MSAKDLAEYDEFTDAFKALTTKEGRLIFCRYFLIKKIKASNLRLSQIPKQNIDYMVNELYRNTARAI